MDFYCETCSAYLNRTDIDIEIAQAFEWTIEGVSLLRDIIENDHTPDTSGENMSERSAGGDDDVVHPALKEAPMLGDGRFMLEIGMYLLSYVVATAGSTFLIAKPKKHARSRPNLQKSIPPELQLIKSLQITILLARM